VVPVDSYEAGIQRVLGGTSDVFFGDRQILIEAVSRNPARNDLMVLTDQFTYETVALALARDDEDFRLLVDQTLSGFYNSRAFYDEYTRWFGKPPASTIAFFTAASLPD
jgi:polar amino acid transport system substrate-binding protein